MERLYAGALALALCAPAWAYAAGACGPERYYAPEDPDQERPLRRPHAEFQSTLERANAGDAVQQRNMGAYYEAGYLVSKCLEQALYWYSKAAAGGDKKAEAWLQRRASFQQVRQASGCGGSACSPAAAVGAPTVELLSDGRGHFFVPVTINGMTVNGLVDTGADTVSISSSVAKQMGIDYARGARMLIMTANGPKAGYRVVFGSVQVGAIALDQVAGSVSDGDMPLLLGMSFLGRLKVSVDAGRMTLARP